MSTTSDLPTLSPTDEVFTDYEAGKIRMHATVFNTRLLGDTFITLTKIDGPFERAPETGLGALDNLPAETLMEIVRQLDLNSIWRLREVSVAARDLVHSSPEYRTLGEERVLADAIRTSNIGHKIKLQMFAHLVQNKNCELCSQPGEWLAVKFWQRLCERCICAPHPDIPDRGILTAAVFQLGQAQRPEAS